MENNRLTPKEEGGNLNHGESVSSPNQPMQEKKDPNNLIVIVVVIIFVVVGVLAAYFLLINKNIETENKAQITDTIVQKTDDTKTDPSVNQGGQSVENKADKDDNKESGEIMDDAEDDDMTDSDNDGLTNYEERILGTNPNKNDSDGDGYLDGDEIEKGFNPKGEGKSDVFSETGVCQAEYQRLIDKYGKSYSDCYGDVGGIECKEQNKQTNMVMILDASGSMAGQIQGQTKADIARQASLKFIDNLNKEINFSLVMYGHKGNNQYSGKTESCNGIEELHELNPIDKTRASKVVGELKAVGYTPIAKSLESAKNILASSAGDNNMVLLVSDGKETCGGNPSSVSETLKASGVKVNVVGFDVGGEAEGQLRNVADVSGGTYYSARTLEELTQSLINLTKITCSQKENAWSDGMDSTLSAMFKCTERLHDEALNISLDAGLESPLEFCEEYIDEKYSEREQSIEELIERAYKEGEKKLDELSPENDDGEEFDDFEDDDF